MPLEGGESNGHTCQGLQMRFVIFVEGVER